MPENTLHNGDAMPPIFKLPAVDGKNYSSDDFPNDILVIVFSCNHCPYVQAYEERMITFQKEYAAKGIQLVAINSNDEVNYPDDNFESMVKRAKLKGFNFLYLRDADQTVANTFGATHTPQFFVFDKARTLRYSGKFDDSWKDAQAVKENYLRDAVDALLVGKDVKVKETYSIGCTIKWK
jgi:thiol-disulfide isomerase/thioredoxin